MVVCCKDNSLNWSKLKSDTYSALTCKYKPAMGSVFQGYCVAANTWQPRPHTRYLHQPWQHLNTHAPLTEHKDPRTPKVGLFFKSLLR